MLKLIRYMFYRSYRITLKIGRRADPFPSLGLIGIPLIFNIFTIQGVLKIISSSENFDLPVTNRFSALILAGILIYFLFSYLVIDERRLAIFREFDKQTNKQKWIWNIIVVLYLVLTVLLYFCTSEITREMYRSGVL